MIDITSELHSYFKRLNITVANTDIAAMELSELVKKCVKENESDLYRGVRGIGERIQQTKQEIAGIIPEGAVADAKVELDAVVHATEDATNKILDAVEELQKLVKECQDKELGGEISAEIAHIFEACNFQDLTGQRIRKVMAVLKFVESSVDGMLKGTGGSAKSICADSRPDAHLMNGPQLDGNKPSQDEVDKLFDSA